jgi:hypothetical protein
VAILVTVSLNLAESVSLRELQRFVEAAERNGADVNADLREYAEDNELVGLAAVGQFEADDEAAAEDRSDGSDEDVDAADEADGNEADGDEGDDDPLAQG